MRFGKPFHPTCKFLRRACMYARQTEQSSCRMYPIQSEFLERLKLQCATMPLQFVSIPPRNIGMRAAGICSELTEYSAPSIFGLTGTHAVRMSVGNYKLGGRVFPKPKDTGRSRLLFQMKLGKRLLYSNRATTTELGRFPGTAMMRIFVTRIR